MPEHEAVKPGDVTARVGVEVIRARGVDVDKLIKMVVANAAAEFASTYYYYTILPMNLAGYEDYKEIARMPGWRTAPILNSSSRAFTNSAVTCRTI